MFESKYLEDTIKVYQENVDTYISLTNKLNAFPVIKYYLDYFIKLLDGNKVLDVGFGSGRDLEYFILNNIDIEGIDISSNFVKKAKSKLKIPLFVGDMRNFCPSHKKYSGIWCCASLVHINDADAKFVFYNFNKMLLDNGVLYVSVKKGMGCNFVKNKNLKGRYSRFYNYYDMEKLKILFNISGFKILHIKEVEGAMNTKEVWINAIVKKYK